MEGYGWKGRTYESIAKANRMTRAHWLTMERLSREPELSYAQAEDFAWAQIDREDRPQFELQS